MKGLMHSDCVFHGYLLRGGTTFHPMILLIRAKIANQPESGGSLHRRLTLRGGFYAE